MRKNRGYMVMQDQATVPRQRLLKLLKKVLGETRKPQGFLLCARQTQQQIQDLGPKKYGIMIHFSFLEILFE